MRGIQYRDWEAASDGTAAARGLRVRTKMRVNAINKRNTDRLDDRLRFDDIEREENVLTGALLLLATWLGPTECAVGCISDTAASASAMVRGCCVGRGESGAA